MSTDFSSIDRLVEFGMGLGLAQQMVNTMNHTMNSMQIAGVNAGTTGQCGNRIVPDISNWYVVVDDKIAGPLNKSELEHLIKGDKIKENTLMWCGGMKGWEMACNIPEINKLMLLLQ